MKPNVLDVSHHNSPESWDAIKASGIQGVVLKCTQGIRFIDHTYVQRRDAAAKAGLLIGAYHFATDDDPTAQVNYFLWNAKPDSSTLLALDWERNPDGADMSVKQAKQWLEYIMQKTGRSPKGIVVYGGDVLKEFIRTDEDIAYFSRFPLWLASYNATPKLPKAWKSYFMWQYSETGKCDGMHADGNVDLNFYAGQNLAAEWAPNVGGVTSPTPVPVLSMDEEEPAAGIGDAIAHEEDDGTGIRGPAHQIKLATTSPTIWGIISAPFIYAFDLMKHASDGLQNFAGSVFKVFSAVPTSNLLSGVMDSQQSVMSFLGILGLRSAEIGGAVAIALLVMAIIRHTDELSKGDSRNG